jgi:hypothetical protein
MRELMSFNIERSRTQHDNNLNNNNFKLVKYYLLFGTQFVFQIKNHCDLQNYAQLLQADYSNTVQKIRRLKKINAFINHAFLLIHY